MNLESYLSRRAALASMSAVAVVTATGAASVASAVQAEPAAKELLRNSSGGRMLPIVGLMYSKFKMYKVADSDLDAAATFEFPFIAGSKFKAVNTGISEPIAQINFEDFLPGPDIVWTMFHDEIQYVTAGRAQITFHLAPLMHETGTVTAEPGCIYLLPRGARIVWRVLDSQPFRHLCVCVPSPGYPIPVAVSVRGG